MKVSLFKNLKGLPGAFHLKFDWNLYISPFFYKKGTVLRSVKKGFTSFFCVDFLGPEFSAFIWNVYILHFFVQKKGWYNRQKMKVSLLKKVERLPGEIHLKKYRNLYISPFLTKNRPIYAR